MIRLTLVFVALLFVQLVYAQHDPPPAELDTPPAPEAIDAPPSINEMPDIQAFDAPAPSTDKTYEMFDIAQPPSFPGGEKEMFRYLSDSLQYPSLALENGIEGRVVISFIVDRQGDRTDIKLIKDIGGGCGTEAIRLVKAMPSWIPGESNGHKVRVRYTLPILFRPR